MLLPIAVAESVELLGGLLVGAGLEQLIELGDEFGLELFDHPVWLWRRHGERCGLSAAEPDMNGDRLGLNQRHVLDQESEEPFALARLGERIVPHAWKILSEREDALTGLWGEQALIG